MSQSIIAQVIDLTFLKTHHLRIVTRLQTNLTKVHFFETVGFENEILSKKKDTENKIIVRVIFIFKVKHLSKRKKT